MPLLMQPENEHGKLPTCHDSRQAEGAVSSELLALLIKPLCARACLHCILNLDGTQRSQGVLTLAVCARMSRSRQADSISGVACLAMLCRAI